MKKLVAVFLVLACLCLASIWYAKRAARANSILTQKEIGTYVKDLIPILEAEAGKQFKRIPECRLVSVQDLATELVPFFRKKNPKASEVEILRKAKEQAKAECFSVGWCSYSGDVFLVLEYIPAMMKSTDITVDEKEGFIKLVISHELAHALVNQWRDKNLWHLEPDSSAALDATSEGFANFVESRVAKHLRIQGISQKIREAYRTGKIAENDAESRRRATDYKLQYLAGQDFIEWHFNKGGMEKVWRVLLNPPAASAMSYHPETYSPKLPPDQDYGKVLNGLEQKFGNHKWEVSKLNKGAYSTRSFCGLMPDQIGQVMLHADHLLMLDLTNAETYASVMVAIMDSPEQARSLAKAFLDHHIGQVQKEKDLKQWIAPYQTVSSDGATKYRYRFTNDKGKPVVRDGLTLARGRVMIMVLTRNTELSDKQLKSLLETIFQRLPKSVQTAN